MTLYKRDIIINFNMHKCIQNNNINVNLVSTCLHYCCYCVCFFCHSTDSFCFHMCFEFSMRPSNACCRGFDEFIAVRYSTIRVMTNFQYALNTSFFSHCVRSFFKQSTHMPPILKHGFFLFLISFASSILLVFQYFAFIAGYFFMLFYLHSNHCV